MPTAAASTTHSNRCVVGSSLLAWTRLTVMLEIPPRRGNVGANLRHQLGDAGKLLFAAQVEKKRELHPLAVEIAVEIEQMRLDRARLVAERRVEADVGDARYVGVARQACAYGVHAV